MRNPKGQFLFTGKNGKYATKERGQDYRNGKPLVILPENAISGRYDYYYSHHTNLINPTNDGKGYTKDEIEDMIPIIANNKYIIENSNKLNAYFRNSKNWLMANLEPAMESTKHKSVYIEHSITQLGVLRIEMELCKKSIDQRIEIAFRRRYPKPPLGDGRFCGAGPGPWRDSCRRRKTARPTGKSGKRIRSITSRGREAVPASANPRRDSAEGARRRRGRSERSRRKRRRPRVEEA